MGRSRLARFLAPLMVAALITALAPMASAAETFPVIAGGFSDEQSAVAVNDFAPHEITVNVGDTVTWQILGFHNVLFPGQGDSPPLIIPNPDNPQQLIFNPVVAFPSGGDAYDGTELRNSGLPAGEGDAPPTYSLTFTAAGNFAYFCSVHPGMAGRVVVQSDGALPMTPAQVAEAGRADVAEHIAAVIAEEAAIQPNSQPVLMGVVAAEGDAESLHFAPNATTVRVGESVTWAFDADSREIHTVTFLSGTPAISLEQVIENPAGPPTIAVNPVAAAPAGGSSYNGTGFTNSGILAPGQTYTLTFTQPGSYEYFCIVHGDIMKGTVTVQAAAVAPAATTAPPPSAQAPSSQAPASQAPAAQAPAAQAPAAQAPAAQAPAAQAPAAQAPAAQAPAAQAPAAQAPAAQAPAAQAPAAQAPAPQVPAKLPATGDGSTLLETLGTLALPSAR